MKKHSFLAGALTAALVFSAGASALALSGQVSFGGVSVVLKGRPVIAAGETLTAANGEQIPGSILYTDAKNGGTTYLPLRVISELMDAAVDYDGATGTVFLGGVPTPAGGASVTLPDGGTTIVPPPQGAVSIPTYLPDDTRMGPFTKVESRAPAEGETSKVLLPDARFTITKSDYGHTFRLSPSDGKFVSVTVTNNNTKDDEELILSLYHDKLLGPKECIPSVKVAPGQSVTCTIALNETATELNGALGVGVTYATAAPYTMDATIQVVQF